MQTPFIFIIFSLIHAHERKHGFRQFTLYAVLKGNKPDFHESMRADSSLSFFNSFVQKLGIAYGNDRVKGLSCSCCWNMHASITDRKRLSLLFTAAAAIQSTHMCVLFSAVGAFGKYMAVSIVNDGPVTITIDSPKPPINAAQKQGKKKAGNEPELTENEQTDKSWLNSRLVLSLTHFCLWNRLPWRNHSSPSASCS